MQISVIRCSPKSNDNNHNKCFTVEEAELFLPALDREYTYVHKPHIRNLPNGKQITVKGYTETKTLGTQFKVFFYIALFDGCRREEIIDIKWSEISFENNTILIDSASRHFQQRCLR